ncbi:putative pectinesterase/pectinesterase inhibitor 22 [Vigna radiata var. radiata]|uniref:Pectinesterase/pectinesterase inhibitor 22 n=1 Tax=Vigna radiata var. radiata TaxID=3916 RepID=A0A3Q0EQ71_VIGRR|nr:putative pectinesterase/pectinesterase inhibitor 22 [Vigna radiata var. radiata]
MKNSILVLVTLLIIVNVSNSPKWDRELLVDKKDLEVLKYDVVVALDDSGNFTTISKAIAATSVLSSTRIIIKIKADIFQENMIFPSNKTNIFLVGDEKGITIITGTKNKLEGYSTLDTKTVVVDTWTIFVE